MKKLFLLMVLIFATLFASSAQAFGLLPDLAAEMADELDAQLTARIGGYEQPAGDFTVILTTPVNLNNLERVSPLARLMKEELAVWLVSMGYRVQEIRKGSSLLFAPETGELLLTREANSLEERNIQSAIIVTGTYIVSSAGVRFNIRMLRASSNEVLAMAGGSLPLTGQILELLDDGSGGNYMGITPSVQTTLRPPVRQ